MPDVHVKELVRLQPRLTFTFHLWGSADFRFEISPAPGGFPGDVTGLTMAKKVVSFRGTEASCTSDQLPLVPDDLNCYVVKVHGFVPTRETASQHRAHGDTFHVWLARIDVTLVPVDAGGNALPARALSFYSAAGGVSTLNTTDGTGRRTLTPDAGEVVTIRPRLPWVVHNWTAGAADRGRVRTAQVKIFEAGFIAPPPGAHEWTVNRDTANAGVDERGREVTIKIGGRGDAARQPAPSTAPAGGEVFVVCTFSMTTRRTDTGVAVLDLEDHASSGGGRRQTGKLTLDADGTKTFRVNLGFAGGETCRIEIGTQKNPDGTLVAVHETLDFETWRELDLVMAIPKSAGPGKITDLTVLKSTTDADLPVATAASVKAALDPVKVKLRKAHAEFYDATKLGAGGDCLLANAAIIGNPGRQSFFLCSSDATTLAATLPRHDQPDTIVLVACDQFTLAKDWTQNFPGISQPQSCPVLPDRYALPAALDNRVVGVARGAFAISRFGWKITHYLPSAGGGVVANTDPAHPLYAYRNFTEWTDATHIRRHVSIEYRQVTFSFPATDPTYPGALFPLAGPAFVWTDPSNLLINARVMFELQIQGVCVQIVGGGANPSVGIILSTDRGQAHANGLARVIVHEIGHMMGQGYAAASFDARSGRANAMPGIPFPATVPTAGAKIYRERGHTGVHCAEGLGAAIRGDDPYGTAHENAATCVMFGAGDMKLAKVWQFCADCATYVRAENLSNIHDVRNA